VPQPDTDAITEALDERDSLADEVPHTLADVVTLGLAVPDTDVLRTAETDTEPVTEALCETGTLAVARCEPLAHDEIEPDAVSLVVSDADAHAEPDVERVADDVCEILELSLDVPAIDPLVIGDCEPPGLPDIDTDAQTLTLPLDD